MSQLNIFERAAARNARLNGNREVNQPEKAKPSADAGIMERYLSIKDPAAKRKFWTAHRTELFRALQPQRA